MITDSLVYLVA